MGSNFTSSMIECEGFERESNNASHTPSLTIVTASSLNIPPFFPKKESTNGIVKVELIKETFSLPLVSMLHFPLLPQASSTNRALAPHFPNFSMWLNKYSFQFDKDYFL